jgi:hypothetical protein
VEPLEGHLRRQIEHSREFFWHRVRWAAVKSFFPRSADFGLVDIGAGAGMLGEYLDEELPAVRYHFVEPLESMERILEKRHGKERNLRGATRFEGMRVITLLDVLEHQTDDRAFLADLVAKMDQGAVLIITVPALDTLWSPWDVALGHHRRYSKRALARSWSGLSVAPVETAYLFPEMLPAALFRRLKGAIFRGGTRRADSRAEFPDLPRSINQALTRLGSVSWALRNYLPFGTSLLCTLKKI